MLIALLALLGVNLVVVGVLLVGLVSRRRWVSSQAGSFKGIAHVVDGKVHGLGGRPRRGYGRWVRDVLVWTPAPFFFRNGLTPIDRIDSATPAAGKVRRLGDEPLMMLMSSSDAVVEVTVRRGDAVRVAESFIPKPKAAVGGEKVLPAREIIPRR